MSRTNWSIRGKLWSGLRDRLRFVGFKKQSHEPCDDIVTSEPHVVKPYVPFIPCWRERHHTFDQEQDFFWVRPEERVKAATWHGFDNAMTKSCRSKGTVILQRLAGLNRGQLKQIFMDLCYHQKAMGSHCLTLKDSMPKKFELAWYAGQTLSSVFLQECKLNPSTSHGDLHELWYGGERDSRGMYAIGPWETLKCDVFFDKVFWLAFSLYAAYLSLKTIDQEDEARRIWQFACDKFSAECRLLTTPPFQYREVEAEQIDSIDNTFQ